MNKKKILIWSDFVVPTGFGNVAKNLFSELHKYYEVSVLGINYYGDKKYDTSKYFVYPVSKDDPLGIKKLPLLIKNEQPDILLLFQDIFYISDHIKNLKSVMKPEGKIVVYFPVDGQPFSIAWKETFEVADAVITYSDWAINTIKSVISTEKELHKLYHGVDTNIFKPLPDEDIEKIRKTLNWEDKFVIVNVNRFQPRKAVPLSMRAFSMFAKGYKVCKCGNKMPLDRKLCDLNMCPPEDIVDTIVYDKKDVMYYMHMRTQEPSMGPGRANLLQNHLLNAGFNDEDAKTILALNGANIYNGDVTEEQLNEIYNAANINISSTLGEGKIGEGTFVLTYSGYRPVEDLKDIDQVFNDKGDLVKVNKTLKSNFETPAYRIIFNETGEEVVLSEDHKVLTKRGYVRTDELQSDDIILLKIPDFKQFQTLTRLDLYLTQSKIQSKYKKSEDRLIYNYGGRNLQIPMYVDIDEEFTKFLGIYVGIGSFNAGIKLYPKINETEIMEYVTKVFNEKINIYKTLKEPTKVNRQIKESKEYIDAGIGFAYNFFRKYWGNKKTNKKIPGWLFNLNQEMKESFIEGLKMSVGNVFETYNIPLAYGIRDLYLSMGKNIKLTSDFVTTDAYKFTLYLDEYKPFSGEYLEKTIDKIKVRFVKTYGHDLEVPVGESYTLGPCTVHNCGLSLLESAATGTPSIAPKNSAIPEMLNGTGHLIKNSGLMNQALDNGHLRPVVDVWEMKEVLEQEYNKWKQTKGKVKDQACIDNINNNFLWQDKRDLLHKILEDVTRNTK